MSYHRQRSMPHARGYRIRSKSRLPRKRVPSVKFHSSTKSRRPSHRENSIRYPLQVEDEIKFYETEHRRFLAQVEIRNLTPFAMIYKLFHSNPALEPTEFTISSSYGFVQFDEVLSILIAPARYLSPEYMEEAIFELWIAPKAIYPWEKGRDIGSNWPVN
ncbi:unnamed protein product [Orchesella dallaii]|uniref:Uncharacterized protein n=1 Tax=Orchesella dallaii TaxID=48710 RepID=A0ABP1R1B9_9HEXA